VSVIMERMLIFLMYANYVIIIVKHVKTHPLSVPLVLFIPLELSIMLAVLVILVIMIIALLYVLNVLTNVMDAQDLILLNA